MRRYISKITDPDNSEHSSSLHSIDTINYLSEHGYKYDHTTGTITGVRSINDFIKTVLKSEKIRTTDNINYYNCHIGQTVTYRSPRGNIWTKIIGTIDQKMEKAVKIKVGNNYVEIIYDKLSFE